jgi:hypothetical protein
MQNIKQVRLNHKTSGQIMSYHLQICQVLSKRMNQNLLKRNSSHPPKLPLCRNLSLLWKKNNNNRNIHSKFQSFSITNHPNKWKTHFLLIKTSQINQTIMPIFKYRNIPKTKIYSFKTCILNRKLLNFSNRFRLRSN